MHSTLKSAIVVVLLAIAAGCRSTPPDASATSSAVSTIRGDPVYAYVELMRGKLSAGKTEIYQEIMSPTAQEAGIFWPIYREYEKELYALGDRRLEQIKRFAEAYNAGKLDVIASEEIATAMLKIQGESVDLLKKYHARIAKELSPLQASQFLQVEHRVATVRDLLIAAELPLLRLNPIGANPPPARD